MTGTPYHAAWQLEADQLLSAGDRCPICGSVAPRQPAGVIQREPLVHLLACGDCGGCSASHMPTPEILAEYYRCYFRADGPKITLTDANAFADHVLRLVRLNGASSIRILDFGGGDGTLGLMIARRLLHEEPARQIVFTLVDFQTPAAGISDERLVVTHARTLEEVCGEFDLVLASAVLEHIPELERVIRRLLEQLGPGGWFYARTPYLAPLKRCLPGLDITFPGHVHDLGAPFWNRIGQTFRVPLRIVASRPSLIETSLRRQPARTAAAWLMKFPARVELAFSREPRTPWWRFVGGWEVVLQKAA